MVLFVALTKTLEDLNGVGDGGLFDLDGLEAAFKRSVLFEVLAVFIERGCTNGLEFTTGKHRLEDRRCVDCAFSSAGTDKGVDLVDEQDDVAAGLDFLEDLLEAFLEVTAITRTCD